MNLFDRPYNATRVLVLCLLIVAVCYANSIPNAFILDDILIVGANERIRHFDPVHFLFQSYWGDLNHAGIYRPLTISTFSAEYALWQVWAPGIADHLAGTGFQRRRTGTSSLDDELLIGLL